MESTDKMYQTITQHLGAEWALCDNQGIIQSHSSGLIAFLHDNTPLTGSLLSDIFFEFMGMESLFPAINLGQHPPITFHRTARLFANGQQGYLTIKLSGLDTGLLFIATNNTTQTESEQKLMQQRNELHLIAEQLTYSKSQLQTLLYQFVPESVAQAAMNNPNSVQPGGQKRDVAVLFADIRGFTSFSEVREPDIVLNVLNHYFNIIGQIIVRYGGTISQYGGDMVMALFNTPNEQPDYARKAVQAGLEIQAALTNLRHDSQQPLANFGIGIASGPAVVGYLGFRTRLDYTAIGDTINIGARLSALSHGGEVLMGPKTFVTVQNEINTQLIGPLRLKGKIVPVMVYKALEMV